MSQKITYAPSIDAWKGFLPLLKDTINRENSKKICDIGGGANPHLPREFIQEKDLAYTLLDISQFELNKADNCYNKICADITSKSPIIEDQFDLMFSKMLMEHVKDVGQMHKNIFKLLRPGGIAIHFFPTLYSIPFCVNRIVPETLASMILDIVSPRSNRYQHEKFPAYYNWCRGPSQAQLDRLKAIGFKPIEYKGFFGHEDYYRRLPLLKSLHIKKTKWLLEHPKPIFTSYAIVVLQKPFGI